MSLKEIDDENTTNANATRGCVYTIYKYYNYILTNTSNIISVRMYIYRRSQ